MSVARAAEAAAAPLRARAGEAGGGVAPLPPLLLPLLGDPVDMAEILAVRRVTLSSSSSIGGPAEAAPGRGIGGGGGGLIFFFFFFRNRSLFRPPLFSLFTPSFWITRENAEEASRRNTQSTQREERRSVKARERLAREETEEAESGRGAQAKKEKKKKNKSHSRPVFFSSGRCGASWWASRLSFDHDAASDSYCSRTYINLPTFSLPSAAREEETRWFQRRERGAFHSR